MEETTVLILLAVVMLIGSYLTGSIPLVVNLSEVKWNWKYGNPCLADKLELHRLFLIFDVSTLTSVN